jgi:hypothetical protein
MLDSTPDRSVAPDEILTQAGLDRYAQLVQTRSRLSAAGKSLEMAMNMRADVMTGPAVEAYRTMAKDSAYNRGTDFDRLSELNQIDILTVWNYAPTGDRLLSLTNGHKGPDASEKNIKTETQWLYEIHRIMSLNTRIAYLQLELMNRDSIVNAAILATLNDDN